MNEEKSVSEVRPPCSPGKASERKLLATLKMALLGAAIADGLIVFDNVTFAMWQHGYLSKSVHDWLGEVAVLQTIPSAIITSAIQYKGGLLNEYVVNGILGAFIFGAAAAIWQFWIKDYEK